MTDGIVYTDVCCKADRTKRDVFLPNRLMHAVDWLPTIMSLVGGDTREFLFF